MSGPLVLVLDAGTSGFAASVHDLQGRTLSRAARRWSAVTPEAAAPFGHEYDPETLFAVIDEASRAALAECDASTVVGVGVTGQRIACALLDEAGETLYVGPNADIRALEADLSGLDAEAIYRDKGRFPPWMYAPARVLWFAAHAPEIRDRVHRVVSLPGWILARLGVEGHLVDPTLGADLLMVNVDGVARAPIRAGLPDAAWPALADAHAPIGALHRHLCLRWGLDRRVVAAVGIADTQAALLGAGATGDLLVAGGSAPLIRPTAEPVRDASGRLWTSPTAEGSMLEANLGEMGTMHEWLRALLAVESFEAFDELAADAPVGCRGLSSHLGPRAMNLRALNTARPAATWMPFGQTMRGAPAGRAELARAYLESCAFAARAGREWLDEATPAHGPLTLVGGLRRSALLPRILASTLKEPVRVAAADATATGAAMVAAVACGALGSLSEARAMIGDVVEVTPEDEDAHEDAFETWLEREEQLEEL